MLRQCRWLTLAVRLPRGLPRNERRSMRRTQIAALAAASEHAAQLADLFRLLGDSSRLRIVIACLDKAVPVGALADQLGLSPSLVSHHLRLLRGARIVKSERKGKQVFYSAADDHIRCVIADMFEHISEPDEED